MARYVHFIKYTPEALRGVRKDSYESRVAVLGKLNESAGGHLEQMYFINSPEWDFMSIVEVDAKGAFAINSMAEASGSVERALMYEVFTAGEADEAIAGPLSWSPPGSG